MIKVAQIAGKLDILIWVRIEVELQHWWEMFRFLSPPPITSDLYASQFLHQDRLGNRNVNKQSSSLEIPAPFSQICEIFLGCFKQPNPGLQSIVTDLRRSSKCIKAFFSPPSSQYFS